MGRPERPSSNGRLLPVGRRAFRGADRPPPAGLSGPFRRYALLVGLLAALSAVPTYAAIRVGFAAMDRYGALGVPDRPAGSPAPSEAVVVPSRGPAGVPSHIPPAAGPSPAPGPAELSRTSRWVWQPDSNTWRWQSNG